MLEDELSNEGNVPKDDDETQNSVFKKSSLKEAKELHRGIWKTFNDQ